MFETKKITADLEGEFACTGHMVFSDGVYYGIGFDRENADAISEFINADGDSMVYDSDSDSFSLKCGDDSEIDGGEDVNDLHLYFIGSEMGFAWGYDD